MNIIEKLGITPGPWKVYKGGNFTKVVPDDYNPSESRTLAGAVCSMDDWDGKTHSNRHKKIIPNASIIATAPEMLEALIEDVISYEFSPGDLHGHSDYVRNKKIIEKATGKSWEEIKKLL